MNGNGVTLGLTILACLGSGMIAGAFYAFSTFIMKALSRLPSADGAAAMRSINVAVINPMFLGVLLGTSLLCLALAVLAGLDWNGSASLYLISGSTIQIVGTFFVTMFFNVPLNDQLASAAAGSNEVWENYLRRWTFWNHIRTAASVIAAVLFMIGIFRFN